MLVVCLLGYGINSVIADKGLFEEEFEEAFELFDKDSDGTITADELGAVMRSLGRNPTREELETMMAEVDEDGSGVIEFPEFLNLMASQLQHTDSNSDGAVTADELGAGMRSLGCNTTREELEAMIAEVDEDGSGEIEFPEFQKLRASKLRRWVRLGSMVALGWILLKASSSGSWLVSQWPKFSSYVVIWMYGTAVGSKWVLGAVVAFATRVWAFSKYVLGAARVWAFTKYVVGSKWVSGAAVAFASRVWVFSQYVLGAVVAFATRVWAFNKFLIICIVLVNCLAALIEYYAV